LQIPVLRSPFETALSSNSLPQIIRPRLDSLTKNHRKEKTLKSPPIGRFSEFLRRAVVIVTDSTGFSHNTLTGQDGTFAIPNLQPGTYKLEVEVPGYKHLTQERVQVMAGIPVNLHLGLEEGSERESVAIQGQAPLADDSGDRIAHSYTGRVISELPVQDINHEQLVELMPGVTPPAVSTNILIDPQRNRTWNVNGQQAQGCATQK